MAETLSELGAYLWTQSWQIAVMVLLVAIACRLLREESAHWRYLLWMVVLVKCVLPPIVEVPVALLPSGSIWEIHGNEVVETGTPPSLARADPAITSSERPSLPGQDGSRGPGASGAEFADGTSSGSAGSPSGWTEAAGATGAPSGKAPLRVPAQAPPAYWAGIAWVVGAGLFCLVCFFKALRLHRQIRSCTRPANASLVEETARLAARLGLRRAPRVFLAEGVSQPFVWGFLRGSVYLPADFREGASSKPAQWRAVLMHEIAHVARWDAAINTLQTLIQGILFFHPLVWWANGRIRKEREKCCDETAIAGLGVRPGEYGAAIVDSLARRPPLTQRLPSLAVSGPARNITERIRVIMTKDRKFYRRPTGRAVLAAALFALLTWPLGLILTTQAGQPVDSGAVEAHESDSSDDIVMVPCVRKYAVMLVIGPDRMTFEGKDVTWDELPKLLEKVPHRDKTYLAFGITDRTDDNDVTRQNWFRRLSPFRRKFGFEFLSFVGVHRLGDKGGARFEPIVEPEAFETEADVDEPASDLTPEKLRGRWDGAGVDWPGEGTSLDPFSVDFKVTGGRLEGTASGQFVLEGKAKLEGLRIEDNRLRFKVRHRAGTPMDVTLALRGRTIRGEAHPADVTEDDRCQVVLQRPRDQGIAGLWVGVAADKPEEGSSRDPVLLELKVTEDGKLAGTASGFFCEALRRKILNASVDGTRIRFDVLHRTGILMRVTLALEDGELQGEGVPVGIPGGDRCDLRLRRPPAEVVPGGFGRRR